MRKAIYQQYRKKYTLNEYCPVFPFPHHTHFVLYLIELLSQVAILCRLSHPLGRDSRDCRDRGTLNLQNLFTEPKSDNSQGNYNSFSKLVSKLWPNH